MIPETIWEGFEAIKNGFDTHAPELIALGQELELAGDGHKYLVGVLYAYYSMDNKIEFRPREDYESFFVDVTRLEAVIVLPTQKMTSRLAFAQMKEMEKYIGN